MEMKLTSKGKKAVAKARRLYKAGKSPDLIACSGGVSTCVIEYAVGTPSQDTYEALIKYGYARP